jgi:hypothetical protein
MASGTTTMVVNDKDYALHLSLGGVLRGIDGIKGGFTNAGFNVLGAGDAPSDPSYHTIGDYSAQIGRSYGGVDRGFHQ